MGDSAGYPPLRADECLNRMKELIEKIWYGGTSMGDSAGYSPLRANECLNRMKELIEKIWYGGTSMGDSAGYSPLRVPTGEISKFYRFWDTDLKFYRHVANRYLGTWTKFH